MCVCVTTYLCVLRIRLAKNCAVTYNTWKIIDVKRVKKIFVNSQHILNISKEHEQVM